VFTWLRIVKNYGHVLDEGSFLANRQSRIPFELIVTPHLFFTRTRTSSSTSAHYSPLLDIALNNFSPSRSTLGYSHPAPASRPAQIFIQKKFIYKYVLIRYLE
jgi:hypothetical protein